MTWSRIDIVAAIERLELNVDTTLPYHELKGRYRQARYTRSLIGHGMRNLALQAAHTPPPAVVRVRCGDCRSWSRGGIWSGRGGGTCFRWMIPKIKNNYLMSECWEPRTLQK